MTVSSSLLFVLFVSFVVDISLFYHEGHEEHEEDPGDLPAAVRRSINEKACTGSHDAPSGYRYPFNPLTRSYLAATAFHWTTFRKFFTYSARRFWYFR